MTNNSLVNLGDLTKPATVLIEKVSGLFEGYFKPHQIKRVAKAEAEARVIMAHADIDVTEVQRRAAARWIAQETRNQQNIEAITTMALPELTDDADPSRVDDDWLVNFFERSKSRSDVEMQRLWARILAGEANSPGAYSRKTVNLLGDLDKSDAEKFAGLCVDIRG